MKKLEQNFVDGFCAGIRLMCEVFGEGAINARLEAENAVNGAECGDKDACRADMGTVQHDIVGLLKWIAENQEMWINIHDPGRLDVNGCLQTIQVLENEGFLQLIPVVFAQSIGDIGVDKAFTRLSLMKIAESWSHMDDEAIRKEFTTILNAYKSDSFKKD